MVSRRGKTRWNTSRRSSGAPPASGRQRYPAPDTSPASAKPNKNLPDKLVKEVTTAADVDHLRAFQDIADASGTDDRAGGTPGYDSSLAYAKAELDAEGYVTEVQEFPFVYTEEVKEMKKEAQAA